MNSTAVTGIDPARQPVILAVVITSLLTPTAVGTVLYPLVFAAIVRNRKEFSSPYYTYLLSIGVAELLSLYYYGAYGTICILCGACPVPQAVDRFVSAFCGFTLWYLEFSTDLIIAVDRFLAICFYRTYGLFSKRKWVTAMIVVAWISALAISMPMLTWVFPVSFIVYEFQDDFEESTPAIDLFDKITWDILYADLAIEAALCACCVAFFFCRRKATEVVSVGIRRAQRNLLIQSFLSIGLLSATVFLTPYLDVSEVWASYTLVFLYQLVPMNRLFVALSLNSSIRSEVWHLLRRTPKPTGRVIRRGGIRQVASSAL